MIKLNTYEAQSGFSQLITQLANGKEIMITRSGQEFARLTPVRPSSAKRIPGQDKGKAWISEDFTAPLPESLQQLLL